MGFDGKFRRVFRKPTAILQRENRAGVRSLISDPEQLARFDRDYPETTLKPLPKQRHKVVRPVDGKPAVPLEKEIQTAILQALNLRRDVVFVGRFNRGQAVAQDHYGNTRYTQFNTVKGFPDIHGMLVGGRAFWIEVKRPGGKTSDDQEAFLTNVRINGGLAGVATSVEEANAILA